MKPLGAGLILALLCSCPVALAGQMRAQIATAEPAGQTGPISPVPRQLRVAYVCFYNGEETSGMNKICYYNCLQSLAAITLSFTAICPMSINR